MATFNENIGNYPSAIRYASLRYAYTGDSYDLARCVDDGILSEKKEYVLKYGEEFLARDDFVEVCSEKTDDLGFDYKQYVCGKIAVARYLSDDFAGALELAKNANGTSSFAKNNALMTLAMRLKEDNDKQNAGELISALDEVKPTNGEEETLRQNVINALQKI